MKQSKIKASFNALQALSSPKQCSFLVLFVTAHCNAKCRMCFYGEHIENAHKHKELSLEEIEKLSKSFGPLLQLVISGGEPFLRKDLYKIIEYFYKNNGINVLTIPTNGGLTNTILPTVRKICQNMPHLLVRINISLDDIGKLHDDIRKVEGLFNNALETAEEIRKLKKEFPLLTLSSCTVLNTYNAPKIEETLNKIYELAKPDFQMLAWPRGQLWEPTAGKVTLEQYQKGMHQLHQRKAGLTQNSYPLKHIALAIGGQIVRLIQQTLKEERMVIPCNAGRKLLVIDEVGNVKPCETLDHFLKTKKEDSIASSKFGNLKDFDFNIKKLLKTTHAKEINNYIKEKKCHCTYECAMTSSILYEPLQILKSIYNYILRKPVINNDNPAK